MRKMILFCAVVAFGIQAYAGNPKGADNDKHSFSYAGKVLDDSNLEALTGATIRIVELDQTVYADFEGYFTFENIPSGSYTIEVSYVSYGRFLQENVEIIESKSNKRILLSAI